MNDAQPSPAYQAAIEEGARHHAGSKTYSGSFLRPHKPYLSALIAELGITSALDVGAGKGVQYDWVDPADGLTMEQAWGFDVRKYDPCWPPYAAEPEGLFDLVLCTHTISLIPGADLEWFTDRLLGWATKAVFIAEKIGDRKKPEVADPENRAIGWPADEWVKYLGLFASKFPGRLVFSAREKLDRGKITTRYVWDAGEYRGAFEAEPS